MEVYMTCTTCGKLLKVVRQIDQDGLWVWNPITEKYEKKDLDPLGYTCGECGAILEGAEEKFFMEN